MPFHCLLWNICTYTATSCHVTDSSIYTLSWDSLEHHEHLSMLPLFWVTNSFLSLTPPGGLKAMEDCTDPRMTLLQHRWCTLNKFKEMRPVRVCFRMTSLWKSKKIMCVLSIRYYNRLLTHKHQQVVQVYMASCLQGDDSLIKNGEVTWVTPQNASRHLWRSQLITSSSCPLQLEGYVNKAFSFP